MCAPEHQSSPGGLCLVSRPCTGPCGYPWVIAEAENGSVRMFIVALSNGQGDFQLFLQLTMEGSKLEMERKKISTITQTAS